MELTFKDDNVKYSVIRSLAEALLVRSPDVVTSGGPKNGAYLINYNEKSFLARSPAEVAFSWREPQDGASFNNNEMIDMSRKVW